MIDCFVNQWAHITITFENYVFRSHTQENILK